MPLTIIIGDILQQKADVLVIPANREPIVGSRSLDADVFYEAGFDDIRQERAEYGELNYGDVVVTRGYRLKFRHIIHAVTPAWEGGCHEEIPTLEKCYNSSLDIVAELNAKSVAFPLLASKSNKFPPRIAAKTAHDSIEKWLNINKSSLQVYLVIYEGDKENVPLYTEILPINTSAADTDLPKTCEEYTHEFNKKMKEYINGVNRKNDYALSDLELKGEEDKYRKKIRLEYMRRIVDRINSGEMSRSDFMKATGVSKEYLSQIIKNHEDQCPQTDKAIALAIGLKLDKKERMEFLFSLNRKYPDKKKRKGRDNIIEEYLDKGIYDINIINQAIEKEYPDLCLDTKSKDKEPETEKPESQKSVPKERENE